MSKRIAQSSPNTSRVTNSYAAFDRIDGRHPWQISVPEGYVPYRTRRLERGKVLYFNFPLAREMGLIPPQHPDQMTPALTQKVLDTFSLQIINEYDLQNGVRYPKDTVKDHCYMATRYLQLQHSDKAGRTSGDGRGIWNGTFRHKGVTWDVSSRGTGVTCLAPGAVESGRALKTGESEFGYGCGLADVSELLGSALLSEIFHLNGLKTERVLTVIDLGKGCGIGVRAAPNLVRPAHLFLYLKQGRIEQLRQATEYLIQRQIENGQWKFPATASDRYRRMLQELTKSFARFAAHLEREYIFAWLDWDGDNILAEAGIIDYGSIRQFGLRHDQYRYDDVQRFSTNLNEQRGKARLTVQVFAQLVSYLETGRRKTIDHFANCQAVKDFDREFDLHLRRAFLQQIGLDERHAEQLLDAKTSIVESAYRHFLALEKVKTKTGTVKLPDGVNRPAVFNMRNALRELPRLIAKGPVSLDSHAACPAEEFLDLVASSFAKRADRKLRPGLRRKIGEFQSAYMELLRVACDDSSPAAFMKAVCARAEERNRSGRVTGNGAEYIIDEILKAKRRGLSHEEIQTAVDLFISSQVPKSAAKARRTRPASLQSPAGRLFQELVHIAHEHQEDI
jgi:uncharacterized protein YdiU (UPF0061 family)